MELNNIDEAIDLLLERDLRGEVFIDDSGMDLGADGDIGDQNHDSVALEAILSSVTGFEDLESWDIWDLNDEQVAELEREYPGAFSYLSKGGLPKEYAIEHMGWIRGVNGHFEIGELSEGILDRIAEYVHNETDGNMGVSFTIDVLGTSEMEEFTLEELDNALKQGRGVALFQQKVRRSRLGAG